MPTWDKRANDIFAEAIEVEPGEARRAYIEQACAGDEHLRARVEGLLRAHEEAGDFLNRPALGDEVTLDVAPLTEGPGTVIGRYKLLQQIGEGGFGVVYMAEQTEPVRRRVALKIIKLGMDTKQVIGRFEAERQALAMMEHPNIATVLDAGATETGRPYFVMELVKGIPITEYCDTNSLTTAERLDLFLSVCHAVQHAHQKGIIHRDIKPTNVLVTRHGDKPVPKVIDFGIAKATAQRLTEKTVFTQFRQFIGTPEYMSPEQAEMSGLDVDTRSDIYSLGVLLYELLTGTTPFAASTLRGAAYDEIRRIIREDEPLRPSTQINTLGEKLTAVAKHRRSDPGALGKLFRGDLDWIVMKSLEKDPTRRYETANDLAADIERHLGDEPVVAGPPTAGYKLRKFIRRNRAAVAAGGAIAAALLIGAVLSTIGFLNARHERDRAVTAEARESRARRQAEGLAAKESQARQDAERAAAKEAEAHRKAVSARQQAEAERDAKDKALNRAEGLRLAAHSAAELPSNPGLALLLAIEGARRGPRGAAQNNALLAAIQACREHRTLMGHGGRVTGATFSPDSKCVLTTGSQDGTARLWDARTGKQHVALALRAFRFGQYRLPLASASFSADGKRAITLYGRDGASYCHVHYRGSVLRLYTDHVARIWDTSTGKELLILRGHAGRIVSGSFSPDGRRIVTASWDKTARIWDAETGKQLAVLSAGEGSLGSATFSPDGRRVLTVSSGYWYSYPLPPA
ncbi:MAG: serine/threonine-protein kinase, partial [Phycisphaerae bacterium]